MTGKWDPQELRPQRPAEPEAATGFVRFDGDLLRVVVLVGVAAVVVAAVWLLRGRAEAAGASLPAHAAAPQLPSPGTPGTVPPDPTPGGTVTVDVRGAVAAPGIQQLPAGSRVIDAIKAAGGVRAGRGYGAVNLAKVLVDGEQLVVGRGAASAQTDAVSPGSAPSGDPGTSPTIDLNAATAVELEALDGIGPVLAGNIIDWRETNGPFQSVEDLLDVSGIGEQTLAGIRDQVRVG